MKAGIIIYGLEGNFDIASRTWSFIDNFDSDVVFSIGQGITTEALTKEKYPNSKFNRDMTLDGSESERNVRLIKQGYSLLNNEWIRKPNYNPPEIDYKDVDKKFDGIVSDILEIENLINTSNFSNFSEEEIYKHSVKVKSQIMKMRGEGLLREGEFSVENLVFKKLRNEGYIEKIIELISKAYKNIYNE